jgi:hypothetical protein
VKGEPNPTIQVTVTHRHGASGKYLVMEVPNHVIDDLVAVQRGTKGPDLPIQPQLDLTYKLCGDLQ